MLAGTAARALGRLRRDRLREEDLPLELVARVVSRAAVGEQRRRGVAAAVGVAPRELVGVGLEAREWQAVCV